MNVGMLWFDNDIKAELTAKVERAAAYYLKKYGVAPTVCFVHPTMLAKGNLQPAQTADTAELLEKKVLQTGNIEVRSNRSILPNHLWIGITSTLEAQPFSS